MKPKKCVAEHFGSFTHIEFDFENLGLALISGESGSGKSTILDIPTWAMFGVTSKDTDADEIRQWNSEEPTKVVLDIDTGNGDIQITRIRGKASQNDLYYTEGETEDKIRGKNLVETQTLINQRLGVDPDLYMISSYYSQFSAASEFFTVKPKDRRAVLERIVDLSTPVILSERASEARKIAKKEAEALEVEKANLQGQVQTLKTQAFSLSERSKLWSKEQAAKIQHLKLVAESFEDEKAAKLEAIVKRLEKLDSVIKPEEEFTNRLKETDDKIQALSRFKLEHSRVKDELSMLKAELALAQRDYAAQESQPDTCPTCNRPGANPNKNQHLIQFREALFAKKSAVNTKSAELAVLDKEIQAEVSLRTARSEVQREQADNAYFLKQVEFEKREIESLDNAPDIHRDRLEQAKQTKNPYFDQITAAQQDFANTNVKLEEIIRKLDAATLRVTSLSTIYDLSFVLRGELLRNAVAELERQTNDTLDRFFDGIFRVRFSLEDSDKLSVEIRNNGNECSFKALSGGERKVLTACFWKALARQASATAGVSFPVIALDETLHGMSDNLKVKAFRLLEEIAQEAETVLVVEHSDSLKSMFSNSFTVTKTGEESSLEQSGELEKAA